MCINILLFYGLQPFIWRLFFARLLGVQGGWKDDNAGSSFPEINVLTCSHKKCFDFNKC